MTVLPLASRIEKTVAGHSEFQESHNIHNSSSFGRDVVGATQHLCLVVINTHVIVEGTLRRQPLLTYGTVILEHAREVDALTVVPHSNCANEPLPQMKHTHYLCPGPEMFTLQAKEQSEKDL